MRYLVCAAVAAFLALALAACGTTGQARDALTSTWLGRPADDFFQAYGPPASQFQEASGAILYSWTGGQASFAMPAQASTTVNRYTGTADTTITGGGAINIACSVQIEANGPQRTIQSIRPMRDTIGAWNLSRCAELFVR